MGDGDLAIAILDGQLTVVADTECLIHCLCLDRLQGFSAWGCQRDRPAEPKQSHCPQGFTEMLDCCFHTILYLIDLLIIFLDPLHLREHKLQGLQTVAVVLREGLERLALRRQQRQFVLLEAEVVGQDLLALLPDGQYTGRGLLFSKLFHLLPDGAHLHVVVGLQLCHLGCCLSHLCQERILSGCQLRPAEAQQQQEGDGRGQ